MAILRDNGFGDQQARMRPARLHHQRAVLPDPASQEFWDDHGRVADLKKAAVAP